MPLLIIFDNLIWFFCNLFKQLRCPNQIYFTLCPRYLKDSLFLCQKTAIWVIANVHFLLPVLSSRTNLCKRLSILPLPTLHKYFCSNYAHRTLVGQCHEYKTDIFIKVEHRYPLRNKNVIFNPSHHLNTSIVTVFNSLPRFIR